MTGKTIFEGVANRVRETARRQTQDYGAGAERFKVVDADPLKLESFHDDTVLKAADDDFTMLHGLAADCEVGDTVIVITDRNGDRLGVGRIAG